jgi:hypothetical protein
VLGQRRSSTSSIQQIQLATASPISIGRTAVASCGKEARHGYISIYVLWGTDLHSAKGVRGDTLIQ